MSQLRQKHPRLQLDPESNRRHTEKHLSGTAGTASSVGRSAKSKFTTLILEHTWETTPSKTS
jgi:hypothetical protein